MIYTPATTKIKQKSLKSSWRIIFYGWLIIIMQNYTPIIWKPVQDLGKCWLDVVFLLHSRISRCLYYAEVQRWAPSENGKILGNSYAYLALYPFIHGAFYKRNVPLNAPWEMLILIYLQCLAYSIWLILHFYDSWGQHLTCKINNYLRGGSNWHNLCLYKEAFVFCS